MVESVDGNRFELIKRRTQAGMECWTARELQPLLGYAAWHNFANVIRKAVQACESAGNRPEDHFNDIVKMIPVGKGAQRKVPDILLTRHACFLIAMNGDPAHAEIAAAQTYFAIQTGKQERFEQELSQLSADQKRVMLRNELTEHNKKLASAARDAGVVTPFEYAVFQDEGYKGLYGGLGSRDIHERKALKKSEKILDHMGSTELAANLFRATQTEDKLRRDQTRSKVEANITHREIGKKVRKAISDIGGAMPETLPAEQSIKRVQSHLKKKIGKPKAGSSESEAAE